MKKNLDAFLIPFQLEADIRQSIQGKDEAQVKFSLI